MKTKMRLVLTDAKRIGALNKGHLQGLEERKTAKWTYGKIGRSLDHPDLRSNNYTRMRSEGFGRYLTERKA